LANFNQNPISGSAFLDPVGKVVAQRAAGTNILVQLSGSFLDAVPIGSGAANDPIGSGAANDPIGGGAANDPIGSEKTNSLDGDGELTTQSWESLPSRCFCLSSGFWNRESLGFLKLAK
jgi:hypothetical protein